MIVRQTLTDSVDFVVEFVHESRDIETGTALPNGWVPDDSYFVVGDGDEEDRDLLYFLQPEVVDRLTKAAIVEARSW
jgi:hypothetical protein